MHQHDTPDGVCPIFAECEVRTTYMGDWVTDPVYSHDVLDLQHVINALADPSKCMNCGQPKGFHICI